MSVPLFDDTARDGRQGELASLIRRATRIQPFGPNSRAVHDMGGAVHLTPAEAEEVARAVIESDWLRDRLAAERADALDAVVRRADDGIEFGPENFRLLCRIVTAVRAALNGGE